MGKDKERSYIKVLAGFCGLAAIDDWVRPLHPLSPFFFPCGDNSIFLYFFFFPANNDCHRPL
ncbi:hypothetical protein HYS49_00725 [Candidatus Woesearchaeota archaeon]|nr:hypothetical protein [Candidatus Woesearchaeota archaeon]